MLLEQTLEKMNQMKLSAMVEALSNNAARISTRISASRNAWAY